MQLLLNRIGGKTVLLWFADHAPTSGAAEGAILRYRAIRCS